MLGRRSPLTTPAGLVALSLVPFHLAAAEPQPVVWSDKAYGPDGPWNAVKVSIDDQTDISLFPGRMWNTYVTTQDYCTVNNTFAHCQSGSYDVDDADLGPSDQPIRWRAPLGDFSRTITAADEVVPLHLGSVDLDSRVFGPIPNQTLALIDSESHMLEYPGGTRYPIFTGCLSVGAPDALQIFDGAGGESINTTIIPWFLKEEGTTSSSSFGLHYGSAGPSARMSGSLLYGGYDRGRVVGDVLSFPGDVHTPTNLLDISIRVIKGHSPFDSLPTPTDDSSPQPAVTGLLAKGSTSITPAGLPMLLDPCSPYLTLPKSTCDAIAAHLPVTHNPSLGLYLWNTSSPAYPRIVASASALSFTLMGQSNTETLTIHLPFRHLNLTLSPPFTDRAVPYFPCFTGGVAHSFGRAFFQDAFLGANWESKTVWLAQAPGPNVPTAVDGVDVLPGDTEIESGGNDWEKSWEGHWTALKAEEADGSVPVDVTDVGEGPPEETGGTGGGEEAVEGQGGGLSTGAIAGIAVGAALGGMAVVALAVLFWWRRQKKAPASELPAAHYGSDMATAGASPSTAWSGYPSGPHGAYGQAPYGQVGSPAEVHGEAWKVHEMMPNNNVYEAPGDQPRAPGADNGWVPTQPR